MVGDPERLVAMLAGGPFAIDFKASVPLEASGWQ